MPLPHVGLTQCQWEAVDWTEAVVLSPGVGGRRQLGTDPTPPPGASVGYHVMQVMIKFGYTLWGSTSRLSSPFSQKHKCIRERKLKRRNLEQGDILIPWGAEQVVG